MKRKVLTLIAAIGVAIGLTVGAATSASATDLFQSRSIALSNGDTVTVAVSWHCTYGTRPLEQPFGINISDINSGKTYVLYGDQATNGTLRHRESVTASSPQGGRSYAGLAVDMAAGDINMVVKTTGGATLGSKRLPGCVLP